MTRNMKQITQLQIEISTELKAELKILAVKNDWTLKHLILESIERAHPEFKKLTTWDITQRTRENYYY